jgi:hypothetical protein
MRSFSDCYYLKIRGLRRPPRVPVQGRPATYWALCQAPPSGPSPLWLEPLATDAPTSADRRVPAPRLAEVGHDIVAGMAAMLHALEAGSPAVLRARRAQGASWIAVPSARATRAHRDLGGQAAKAALPRHWAPAQGSQPACRRQRLFFWPTQSESPAAPLGSARPAGLSFVNGCGPVARRPERHGPLSDIAWSLLFGRRMVSGLAPINAAQGPRIPFHLGNAPFAS